MNCRSTPRIQSIQQGTAATSKSTASGLASLRAFDTTNVSVFVALRYAAVSVFGLIQTQFRFSVQSRPTLPSAIHELRQRPFVHESAEERLSNESTGLAAFSLCYP